MQKVLLAVMLWACSTAASAAVYVPIDLPPEITEALKAWNPNNFIEHRRNAEAGDVKAQFIVGAAYLTGRMPEGDRRVQDFNRAKEWLRRVAEQGNIDAIYVLGRLYSTGGYLISPIPGLPDDFAEAEKWLLKAADVGHLKASMTLGDLYSKAENFKRNATSSPADYKAAARWYRVAAEQDYLPAQYALAQLYAQGLGVDKDPAEAVLWYDKVLKHAGGDARAYWNLIAKARREREQARLELAAPEFRRTLSVGARASAGVVTAIEPERVRVKTYTLPPYERWIQIEELYPKDLPE